MQTRRAFTSRFARQIADTVCQMSCSGQTTPTGIFCNQPTKAAHLVRCLAIHSAVNMNGSHPASRGYLQRPLMQAAFKDNKDNKDRGLSTTSYAAAPVALQHEETESSTKQLLDLDGELDLDGSLEEEFEEEKGRRSLASLMGSDEEDLVEVDAALQDESLLVENCNLSPETVQALHARGVRALFPIQKHVFDPAMEGRDLIGRAKTGSGKTLAFSLPVIEALMEEDRQSGKKPGFGRPPRCIVLAPTRELAQQVEKEFAASAPSLSLACFFGGSDIGAQIKKARKGLDVVVATPGRIIDLLDRGCVDLGQVKFFILDEADMMLSKGFDEDVDKILESVPEERQTMLFSATMPAWIKRLIRQHLKQPVLVDLVGDSNTGKLNEDIKALAVQVEPNMRRHVLVDVLTVHNSTGKAIIFTQTKQDADEVAAGVAKAMPCESLHGDYSQRDRERKLENFRQGKIMVLVATDVAARGLDIPNVDLVLHYELPRDTESFLHRSGRTARAGKTGTTIALFTRSETRSLRRIIKEVGVKSLEIMGPPSPKEVMEASARQVLRRLDNIDEDVKAFFLPAAEKVTSRGDHVDAMCRALAALSGLQNVPKPRSLLTQQEGYITLRVTSRLGRISEQRHILTMVRNVLGQEACNHVGRIRMLPAAKGEDLEGAAFDLPEEIANEIMARKDEFTTRQFDLDVPKSLPLEEERGGDRPRNMNSRGGGRFGPSNGRRSGRSNDGGYGSSGYSNRRFNEGGGYGQSRGGNYGQSRGGGYRGNGQRSYGRDSRGGDSYRGSRNGGSSW